MRQTRRAVVQYAAVPPVAQVGLVKSVYVGAPPVVKTVEKPVVVAAAVAPAAVEPAQGAGQVTSTVDTTVGEQSLLRFSAFV